MVAGLKQSGLVEGKHFLLHVRDMKQPARHRGVANQLVSERVDLLFTVTTSVTLAAKKATREHPDRLYAAATRCASTHQSYAKPGRSATGVHQPAFDLVPKRLDILKQLLRARGASSRSNNVENPIAVQSLSEARRVAASSGWSS